MLLTVQAVADMAPTSVDTLTWNAAGLYTVTSTVAKDTFLHIKKSATEAFYLDPSDWRLVSATSLKIDEKANERIRAHVITAIQAAPMSFTLPNHLCSWSIRNRSGADIYFRQRRPNIAGHVIDTEALTFSDEAIVGQVLLDDEAMFFSAGDFNLGAEICLCSAADRVAGAIVQFNC